MDSPGLGREIVDWLIELLDILAWPLVVIILACLLFKSRYGREFISAIAGSLRKVRAMGIELELSNDGGQQLKVNLEEEFGSFREQVNAEFKRQTDAIDAERIFHMAAKQAIEPAMREFNITCGHDGDTDFRCTVYVQDIVFSDALYRLFDYYPKGEGHGSTYSIRYGIIGQVWRNGASDCKANVTGDRQSLIKEWGMTEKEAVGQDPSAYFAIVLRKVPTAPPIAVLFIHTKAAKDQSETADEKAEQTCEALAGDKHIEALTSAIDEVMKRLRGKGPRLELVSG